MTLLMLHTLKVAAKNAQVVAQEQLTKIVQLGKRMERHLHAVDSNRPGAMEFLQGSNNPSVLELFMSMIVTNMEKRVEGSSWLYVAGEEVVLRVDTKGNLPDGECVMYYPDRKPALVGQFAKGDRAGNWQYFRPDGSLWNKCS